MEPPEESAPPSYHRRDSSSSKMAAVMPAHAYHRRNSEPIRIDNHNHNKKIKPPRSIQGQNTTTEVTQKKQQRKRTTESKQRSGSSMIQKLKKSSSREHTKSKQKQPQRERSHKLQKNNVNDQQKAVKKVRSEGNISSQRTVKKDDGNKVSAGLIRPRPRSQTSSLIGQQRKSNAKLESSRPTHINNPRQEAGSDDDSDSSDSDGDSSSSGSGSDDDSSSISRVRKVTFPETYQGLVTLLESHRSKDLVALLESQQLVSESSPSAPNHLDKSAKPRGRIKQKSVLKRIPSNNGGSKSPVQYQSNKKDKLPDDMPKKQRMGSSRRTFKPAETSTSTDTTTHVTNFPWIYELYPGKVCGKYTGLVTTSTNIPHGKGTFVADEDDSNITCVWNYGNIVVETMVVDRMVDKKNNTEGRKKKERRKSSRSRSAKAVNPLSSTPSIPETGPQTTLLQTKASSSQASSSKRKPLPIRRTTIATENDLKQKKNHDLHQQQQLQYLQLSQSQTQMLHDLDEKQHLMNIQKKKFEMEYMTVQLESIKFQRQIIHKSISHELEDKHNSPEKVGDNSTRGNSSSNSSSSSKSSSIHTVDKSGGSLDEQGDHSRSSIFMTDMESLNLSDLELGGKPQSI